MRILDAIGELLSKKTSVQMVADDPEMAAQILLLVRMMFADGELSPSELSLFKGLCKHTFNIPEDDVPEVIKFLKTYGYETSGVQAASTFAEMPEDRKKEILGHLVSMARADSKVHENEILMITKVAAALGYSTDQIRAWL